MPEQPTGGRSPARWPAFLLVITTVASIVLPRPALAVEPCQAGYVEETQQIHPAIVMHSHECGEPLYRATTLEIDLTCEDLSFVVTPRGSGRMTTSEFAESVDAFAAINGGYRTADGGYTVSSGHLWGKRGDTTFGAVVGFGDWIDETGTTRVDIRPPEEVLEDVPGWMEHAVTGYPLVLESGEVVQPEMKKFKVRHPRTGLGTSEDGETLYLVTVDGRQSGWSWGLRTWQLGEMFRSLGAYRAVNLDGGGSTTMVVPSEGGLINRPCAKKGPERPVLNHIGVIADEAQPDPTLAGWLHPVPWIAGALDSLGELTRWNPAS